MDEKKNILVVDDLEMNRYILSEIFSDYANIIEAEDGQQAIEHIKKYGKDLTIILLDIVMPVLDGFGVFEFLKEAGFEEIIPVVMITSDISYETEKKGYDYKAADIIIKPFNSTIVRRRIINIIELYEYKRNLEITVEQQMKKLQEQNYELAVKNKELDEYQDSMTETLSNILEFRNNESGGHVKRIKDYTRILANTIMDTYPEYGLTPEKIDLIVSASAMHDIGKISISDEILLKPGKLTEAEYEIMKTHTLLGCDIIESFDFIKDKKIYDYTYDICRHHHERIDGTGYPDGLSGDELSIAAQIVSVADVYDALVSSRCYKNAYAHDDAVSMIKNGECGSFSKKILHCFSLCQYKFKVIFMEMLNTM